MSLWTILTNGTAMGTKMAPAYADIFMKKKIRNISCEKIIAKQDILLIKAQ